MPFTVKAEELKKVARLVGGLKDASPEAQKVYYWNGVHRVVAEEDRFRLLSTNGDFFLDWDIPVEGGLGGEDFDLEISAGQFNEMISYASKEDPFQLEHIPSSDQLVFRQGLRTLRLKATPIGPYPTAPNVTGPNSWTSDAQTLSNALSFMAPIIDATNPIAAKSVATLSSCGVLTGGSPKRFGVVSGLAAPSSPVNLKQRPAKNLASFLEALTGHVEVTDISGPERSGMIRFSTPDHLRSMILYGESMSFPDLLGKLESEPHETWKIDRKSWIRGINIIHAVQPPDANALTLRIRGDKASSSLTISSSTDAALASHDEFQIFRQPSGIVEDPRRADDVLNVDAKKIRESIQALSAVTLTVKHYSDRGLLLIRDDLETARPVRSIVLKSYPPNAGRLSGSTSNTQDLERAHDGPAGPLRLPRTATPPSSVLPQDSPDETSIHGHGSTRDGVASSVEPDLTSGPEPNTTPDVSIHVREPNEASEESPTSSSPAPPSDLADRR